MVIRIMGEDQYRLDESFLAEIEQMEQTLSDAIDGDDTTTFATTLQQAINFVREKGQLVGIDEVIPSDFMLPAPDMTLAEVKQHLGEDSNEE